MSEDPQARNLLPLFQLRHLRTTAVRLFEQLSFHVQDDILVKPLEVPYDLNSYFLASYCSPLLIVSSATLEEEATESKQG